MVSYTEAVLIQMLEAANAPVSAEVIAQIRSDSVSEKVSGVLALVPLFPDLSENTRQQARNVLKALPPDVVSHHAARMAAEIREWQSALGQMRRMR